MYKFKHYVNNKALRMLYHSLITHEHSMGLLPGRRSFMSLEPIRVVLKLRHEMFKTQVNF